MAKGEIVQKDLAFICEKSEEFIQGLTNSRVLLTGGTGFLGTWLLLSLLQLNKVFSLKLKVTVLSRDPKSFLSSHPYLSKEENLSFIQGNILDLSKNLGHFSHVIHGAIDSTSSDTLKQTVLDGTNELLSYLESSQLEAFIFLSSGAVYGEQPKQIKYISEQDKFFKSSSELDIYANFKRKAERIILENNAIKNISVARCFSFLGPYMSFSNQFAIGHFIKSIVQENTINLSSDGSSLRTFLYAADFSIWILKILLKSENKAIINVGSDQEINIRDVAFKVSKLEEIDIPINLSSNKPTIRKRYVPSVSKAKEALNLTVWTDFETALEKTYLWYKQTLYS